MTIGLRIKDGRYYAVISYKEGDCRKQRWIALGLPAKNNKRKAEAMLAELRVMYANGDLQSKPGVLFTDYIKRWLDQKKPYIELSTWEGYDIYATRHIIPYFEPLGLMIDEVTPKHIQDYYKFKYTSGRLDGKSGGLSIPSIKKHSIVLKEVLDDAVLEELIPRNPAVGVKLPAKNIAKRERVFLNVESANAVLKAFEGHPLQPLVYVTLYYGLRRSEALGLRWSAIDFENNTLTINHTVVKNRTIVQKDATKTQSSFHVYSLIDDVRDVLLKVREQKSQCRELLGETYAESDYVFSWPDGTLFRPDYVTRGFQRVLKRSGLPDMRFHDLRHSTASILYDKGWDLKDAQTWLRHSSVEVTGDIYTHISEDRKQAMANELNKTFVIETRQKRGD